jgi:Kef-type K+ transport system membrane component KefB
MGIEKDIFLELMGLLFVVWVVSILLKAVGIPTMIGEIISGILLGPAVLGWFSPNAENIHLLAEIGIFFIAFHVGIKIHPTDFFRSFREGAVFAFGTSLLPFLLVFLFLFLGFSFSWEKASFLSIALAPTALVATMRLCEKLPFFKGIISSILMSASVFSEIIVLIGFSLLFSFIQTGDFTIEKSLFLLLRVGFFFLGILFVGHYVFPRLGKIFGIEKRKAFTIAITIALGFGAFAEAMGLKFILGAFFAGLFLHEGIINKKVFDKVEDRVYGTAYSFLGPIFFVWIGFHIILPSIDLFNAILLSMLVLGGMIGKIFGGFLLPKIQSISRKKTLFLGMCLNGRAELSFIIASIGLDEGILSAEIFSLLIFSVFLINLFTLIFLKILYKKTKKAFL